MTPHKLYKPITYFEALCKNASIDPAIWFIAGGACRIHWESSPKNTDLDVFVTNKEAFQTLSTCVHPKTYADEKLVKGNMTQDGKTFKVDLILVENTSIQDVLNNFDFRCCMIAYYRNEFIFGADAHNTVIDIYEKKLTLNNASKPKSLLRRLQQYALKGYLINETFAEEFLDEIVSNSSFDNTWTFTNKEYFSYQTSLSLDINDNAEFDDLIPF